MCGSSKTTQTQTTTLPKYITDASKVLVSKGLDVANSPFEAYDGDRVADFSADQNNAFQAIRNIVANAPSVGTEAIDGARAYASAPAQSVSAERIVDENGRLGAISDYFNPYVEQALQPALQKIMDAAAARRKQIGAGATAAGAYGDYRHGVVDSELDANTSQAIGDTASNFFMNAFNSAMGQRQADQNRFLSEEAQNAQLAEAALGRNFAGTGAMIDRAQADNQQQLQMIQALLGAGGAQQGLEQAKLDADFAEFAREQGWDFSVLEALGAALSGAPHDSKTVGVSKGSNNGILGALGSVGAAFAGSSAGSSAIAAGLAAL